MTRDRFLVGFRVALWVFMALGAGTLAWMFGEWLLGLMVGGAAHVGR